MRYVEFIDSAIEEILNEKGIEYSEFELDDNSPKVDVESFIKMCTSYKVVRKPLNKKSGEFNEEKSEIVVNILENENRQRFSMAHELGHAFLEHGTSDRIKGSREANYKKNEIINEVMANAFAAKFLMPEKLLYHVKDMVLKAVDFKNDISPSMKKVLIKRMAEVLQVSRESLKYRLENIDFNWEKGYGSR